ncbi:MAG: pitrilysin family protein [Bacillota bacterium]|nr:pitrilysin family protein [Bacillota bacterium]HHU30240.1 insulinase family protein [Bacillota bacterium]
MTGFVRKSLENGIDVYIHPTKKYKTVLLQLFFHCHLNEDEVTQNALLPAVLQRGSANYPTRQELVLHLEELYGAELVTNILKKGERQLICYSLNLVHDQFLPAENRLLEKGLLILCDILTNPVTEEGVFRADYVRQEKEQHGKIIKGLINDKRAYSVERCLQEMCREEPFSVFKYGSLEKLAKIDAASLYRHYRDFLQKTPAEIHIIGDLDPEWVHALLQKVFTFSRGLVDELPLTAVKKKEGEINYVREELDVSQGKLVLGCRTCISYKDDEYLALLMYDGILGGFPHSKLFQNVREKASLAYYAYSRLEKHKGLMVISAGIEVNNYERTMDIIKKQLQDMAKGDFSEEVLENTYRGLRNQYLEEEDSPAAIINRTVDNIMAGRDWSTEELLRRLRAVTRDDIVRVAENIQLDTVYFLTKREGR